MKKTIRTDVPKLPKDKYLDKLVKITDPKRIQQIRNAAKSVNLTLRENRDGTVTKV